MPGEGKILIQPEELLKYFNLAFDAHQNHNTKHDFRGQSTRLPFIVHPWWCALMLLNDTRIPEEVRIPGAKALLLHDVLEDTSMPLPDYVEPDVIAMVNDMTYENFEAEKAAIPHKSDTIKLLKLYDKVATMYDEALRPDLERRKDWKKYTSYLVDEVSKRYPDARIIAVAKAILETTDW